MYCVFFSRHLILLLYSLAGELMQHVGYGAMDRGIQSSLPSLAGESLAARLHLQGAPVDLGEYNLLTVWAICQRITQNFESKDLSMVASE